MRCARLQYCKLQPIGPSPVSAPKDPVRPGWGGGRPAQPVKIMGCGMPSHPGGRGNWAHLHLNLDVVGAGPKPGLRVDASHPLRLPGEPVDGGRHCRHASHTPPPPQGCGWTGRAFVQAQVRWAGVPLHCFCSCVGTVHSFNSVTGTIFPVRVAFFLTTTP